MNPAGVPFLSPDSDSRASASEGTHHPNGEDGSNRGGHDRPEVERTLDRIRAKQSPSQETSHQGADDAEQDVTDDPEALIAPDEEAGEVAGDRSQDDPRNDAHSCLQSFVHPNAVIQRWNELSCIKPRMPTTEGADYLAVASQIRAIKGEAAD